MHNKAQVALISVALAVLYVSRTYFGIDRPAPTSKISPLAHYHFREADADSSGFVDFNEFFFWQGRQTKQQQPLPLTTATTPVSSSTPTEAAPLASSPPPPPPPDISNDNSFMKLKGELPAHSAAVAVPPPPSPPPPPPTSTAVALPQASDNSYMKLGGASTDAARAPALGVTYVAEPSCFPTLHAGFGGGAFTWGMTFKVSTAAECCAACRAHAQTCGPGAEGKVYTTREFKGSRTEEKCAKSMGSNEGDKDTTGKCNTWVFCPTPEAQGGLCWSNDVWNHTYGECWLKHQVDPSRPYAGAYNEYPPQYRKKHRTAPETVQWMSGVLSSKPPVVDGPHWHW